MSAQNTTTTAGSSPLSAVHYENDVTFFSSFLDPYLKYGSGYFAHEGEGFEAAGVRMLDRAIDQAGLIAGRPARVLDVGSGWGSMFRRMKDRGVALEYDQINPSSVQRAHIAEHIGAARSTHEGVLETATVPEGAYDAVFLSDSFCHLSHKGAMLAKLARALAPNGRIVLQDTFFATEELFDRHRAAKTTRFIQSEVFGYAEIVPLEWLVRDAGAAGMRVAMLEEVTQHYHRTVAAWIAHLASLDAARFPLRDSTIRMLRLGAASMGYTTGHYFVVLAPRDSSRRGLEKTLKVLRGGGRSEERQGG
jgi:cyclopropane-fatty-acyl-phospholipid synthase